MGKTQAEIPRQYRQRLKERNKEEYLAKERSRRKRTYKPSCMLTDNKREERNKKNRAYLKQYRMKKRQEQVQLRNQQDAPEESSGYESCNTPMVVNMNFPNRRNGPRMRVARELQKAKQSMEKMKANYEALKKKYRSTMRTMQRRKRTAGQSTPRSKAAKLVDKMDLNKNEKASAKKELAFANVVVEELKLTAEKAPVKVKQVMKNLVVGNLVAKYQMKKQFGNTMKVGRNNIKGTRERGLCIKKIVRTREIARSRDKVTTFMERDDNSRNMPGKADCSKRTDGEKVQRRILTDYLGNLYQKFKSENPGIKLSFASFCRIRPKHILLTSLITRDTCLCTRHQNMSLTLKAAKRENLTVSINGEKMLEHKEDLFNEVDTMTAESIPVHQWKRVEVEVKGYKKLKMKIVEVKMTQPEFAEHIKVQVNEFDKHVDRIKQQYTAMKTLKENLKDDHCKIHMDFSENYSCKTLQEIQSAYWNQTSVTLHPAVIYYKADGSNKLLHKSFVVISDEMAHNVTTVLAIIDQLVPEVKKMNPNMAYIHYWTDSPTSPYRNKLIFSTVSNHREIYGISARWNYWEAGHGKGPCDGLGGTVKRMADEAVNTGKVSIQDALEFHAWTQSTTCSMRNVEFMFLPSEDFKKKAVEIGKLKLQPIVGTMKLHAVVGMENNNVAVRETSCYCTTCISGFSICETWKEESVGAKPSKTKPSVISPETTYKKDDFIAAIYSEDWYVGNIVTVDPSDETYEVSFMERKKAMFQWPKRPDIIFDWH